jgi:hypothetical protein
MNPGRDWIFARLPRSDKTASWRGHLTLTIQALACMSADAIANRYRKNPEPLV